MTQDEIIRMARQAGFSVGLNDPIIYAAHERFAALVAAHEREKLEPYIRSPRTGKMNVSKHYEMQQAVLAEREACAKVCEEFGEWRDTSGVECAAAIRARGEK